MKKILMLCIFITLTTAVVFSEGYDYQLGVGYSGHFMPADEADPSAYPIGYSVFGGLGYAFNHNLSAGLEYEFSHTWSVDDIVDNVSISLQEHLPKAYVRFYSYENLSLTALMGMDILVQRIDDSAESSDVGFTIGARITAGVVYGQYMAVFTDGRADHRFNIGIQFGDLMYDESEENLTSRNE